MKKFLSLVLAMIMTMSLVTISAGATEYKDLTDKDEIQYEEAVAVLNRIGVITGYEDGSFRPETELTRGAAAKIIVSLMIGPDAASALPNSSSPYPDVPANHTFAGVISFCKTEKYISGYGDGTFRPADPLTGYAFAKMLLGAIGYSSDIEGFTGSGWTMNVARIGNVAGLFDRISFDGAAAVTRDQACQLALNTLKATMVTYGGTSIINGSTGSYTIQGTQASPVTSNNRDINANIGRKDWYGGNNQNSDYLTLEFGEEHFKDLRLEHDRFDPAHDDFGRPSNEWSYKKVTIGTFPLEADFTYTTQVAHVEDTDGTKEKALGLRNFDTYADGGYSIWQGWGNTGNTASAAYNNGYTTLWLNGLEDGNFFRNKVDNKLVHDVADIADFTDNGTLVEVYVSSIDADWITDVVVVQTQLMEVKKLASDYVALDQKDPDVAKDGTPNGKANVGFNFAAIDVKVEQVKDTNEECYEVLKGLKEGDEVAVIPVTTDGGKTYEAAKVYVPETVSGTLTRVDTYGIGGGDKERGSVEITVGGTSYKIADWNKDMWDLTLEQIKATRKDVTLLMDEYGNAMLAKDVGSTNDFMVIGSFYQALSGNKICTYVHGWDISGTEVDLNLGSSVKVQSHGDTSSVYGHVIGELVRYTSEGVSGDADYRLTHNDVYDVYTNLKNTGNTQEKVSDEDATFEIKASNLLVPLADKKMDGTTIDGNYHIYDKTVKSYADVDYHNYYFDKSVKFIYVTMEPGEDEVDSIEFKNGAQNVSHAELMAAIMGWNAQGCVKNDQVKAVVIKRESNDASLDNMLYVTNYFGMKEYDKETGEKGFEIEALMYKDGKWVESQRIIVDKDLRIGAFATYSARESSKYVENYYHVKNFNRHNTNPAALFSSEVSKVNVAQTVGGTRYSTALLRLNNAYSILQTGASSSNKLTGISSTAENFSAPLDSQSYVLGDYRGVSTTIDSSITNPNGVIVTKNAFFLNMVSNTRTYVDDNGLTKNWRDVDIDDTEDLIEQVIDKGYKASITVLLNEKADSDGFRTAYLVVINDIVPGTTTETPSGDDVRNTTTGYGTVAGEGTVYANGKKLDSITITAPSWAYVDANGEDSATTNSALKSITYTKYNKDGLPYAAAETKTVSLSSGTTAGHATYANGKYTVQMGGIELKDGDYVTISAIEWLEAKVEYTLNGKDVTNAMGTTPVATTKAIKVGANSNLTFNAGVDGTPAGTFTVTGVKNATNYVNLPSTNINAGPTAAIADIQALGGQTVKVAITSAGASQAFAVGVQTAGTNLTSIDVGSTFSGSVPGANETATLEVKVLDNSGAPQNSISVTDGSSAVFQLKLDTDPADPKVSGYSVVLTLTKANDEKVTLDAVEIKDDDPHTVAWPADSSATVTGVKITAIEKAYANQVGGVSGNTVKVNFTGKVTAIDKDRIEAYDENSSVVPVISATADGSETVSIVLGATVKANFRIIIAGNAVTVASPMALNNADAGIALFTAGAMVSDTANVYLVMITSTGSGSTLSGTVEVTTYAQAKPEEDEGGNDGDEDATKVATVKAAIEEALNGKTPDAVDNNATESTVTAAAVSAVEALYSSVDTTGVTVKATAAITTPAKDKGENQATAENGEYTVTITITSGSASDTIEVTGVITADDSYNG